MYGNLRECGGSLSCNLISDLMHWRSNEKRRTEINNEIDALLKVREEREEREEGREREGERQTERERERGEGEKVRERERDREGEKVRERGYNNNVSTLLFDCSVG